MLTDGRDVTGESVNLAARVRTSAAPDEIRITKEAFEQLGEAGHALSAHSLGVIELKGLASGIALLALDWREREAFPDAVWIIETGQEIPLPDQDTIRFGRLRASDGLPANDIVLSLPDETTRARYHDDISSSAANRGRSYCARSPSAQRRSMAESSPEASRRPSNPAAWCAWGGSSR